MPGAPDTYTDENGKVQVYTLAKYLDDSDPGWRQRLRDEVVKRITDGGFFSEEQACAYCRGKRL